MLVAILLAMTTFISVTAKTITIKVGEEYHVDLNFSSSETVTGTWSKTGNCFSFVSRGSKSCTIKGISVGTGTLSYKGVYGAFDYSTSYDVVVEQSDDSGSGTDTNPPNDDDMQKDSWGNSGNYTISWYNKNDTEFTISTNKELAGMAFLVNNGYTDFEGKTIRLGADIDLNGKNWIAVESFKGVFDGQCHIIRGINVYSNQETKTRYGFWAYLSKATIKNTSFEGEVNVVAPNLSSNSIVRVGGVAGEANSSRIENCKCLISIRCDGFNVADKAIGPTLCIGGILGDDYYSEISYCLREGDIFVSHSGFYVVRSCYIGGICGQISNDGITFCENISNKIVLTIMNNSGRINEAHSIGGVYGNSRYDAAAKFCKSIIGKIYVYEDRNWGNVNCYDIGPDSKHENCFSSVSEIEIRDKAFNYGNGGKACFSNSDISFITYQTTTTYDKNASLAFTSNQMQTPAFFEELNMYSMLEMDDGPVWKQDAEGGYPYIAKLYETKEETYPQVKGDINGDGEVNGTDLVALTNIILGKNEKKSAADVNGDGEVNGTDYVTLANIVLGKK